MFQAPIWKIQKHDHQRSAQLAAELNVKPLTAALLIARGYDTPGLAHQFLNPCIEQLHDPVLLKGMEAAVARILAAVGKREKILIWGDYDVDGTTGTVVLRKALKILGADTEYHIPNRFLEGYGVNIPALEQAKLRGCTVLITVDCGIRSFEPIEWAQANGMDVIVTDHHLSDEVRGNPNAFAVINPNQPGCSYPEKRLAGVGVAYKLAQALLRKVGREDLAKEFLSIAAVGTVADMMELTGENRAIVAIGLRDLLGTNNYGFKALMEVSDCTSEMTSYHIGFRIAPRINAAGRMDAAKQVVELLECEDFNEARRLAGILDSRNRERQRVQAEITELALLQSDSLAQRAFVVVSGENWHRGVIGLAASRIAERINRPTIVLSTENGIAHGSARSVADFHLLDALSSCCELFEQFGGHAAAAGMRLTAENVLKLSEKLDSYATEAFKGTPPAPFINIDAHVSAETLGLDLIDDLAVFEPFGIGNPKPLFVTKELRITQEPLVMKQKHLKLNLAASSGKRFEAVWWDGVDRSKGRTLIPGNRIELAYTAEKNVWQGNARLQLVVRDLREHN